jgi:hypothetical protein
MTSNFIKILSPESGRGGMLLVRSRTIAVDNSAGI